jgi:hypothetical protein
LDIFHTSVVEIWKFQLLQSMRLCEENVKIVYVMYYKVQVICIIHKIVNYIPLARFISIYWPRINRFNSPIKSLKRKWVREGAGQVTLFGWRGAFISASASDSLLHWQRGEFAASKSIYARRETNQREVSCRTINTHNNSTRRMSYVNIGVATRGAAKSARDTYKQQLHFRRNVGDNGKRIHHRVVFIYCRLTQHAAREIELRRLAVSPPQSRIFADA